MIEGLPVGIPGTGFISKGIITAVIAFGIVYYFSDRSGLQVNV